MTKPNELLACPFCGEGVELNGNDFEGYWIECQCRNLMTNGKAEVIAAWNTRTVPMQGEVVNCPECQGNGWVSGSEAGCCGVPTRTGECCGFAIEVQTQEQCSRCCGNGKLSSLPQPVATQDTERRIREICEHYGASLSGAIARDVCALLVQPVAMGEEK